MLLDSIHHPRISTPFVRNGEMRVIVHTLPSGCVMTIGAADLLPAPVAVELPPTDEEKLAGWRGCFTDDSLNEEQLELARIQVAKLERTMARKENDDATDV